METAHSIMKPSRLEAFSDGVIAIIITIMVLELKVPHSAEFSALMDLGAVFLCYVLSFVFVGIYWNNHHHMIHTIHRVSGGILWANLHLLFWLSLIPFFTAWMGENNFAAVPTAAYGVIMLLAAIAYTILTKAIIKDQGDASPLKAAIGKDCKGKVSLLAYAAAIPLAFVSCWISVAIYIAVALLWLIPDRRIEKYLSMI